MRIFCALKMASVCGYPAFIRGFLWPKFALGADSLVKISVQVQIAGKKRMNRRTTRTFGVQFTAHV
jgi:hypothetical protein